MKAPEYLRQENIAYRFLTKDNAVTEPMSIIQSSRNPYDDYLYGGGYGSSSRSTRWPTAAELGFNDSQYKAFKAALTQEYALIQGRQFVGLRCSYCRLLLSSDVQR